MRILLLMRGSAGVGKSTFIEKSGLKDYTLCADDIRLLAQSPQLSVNGSLEISQSNDKVVWEILFKLLEIRMQKGEFTVIDATNSKTADMNRYKQFADKYRYRIYCVDFTDVPIEECKKRNLLRPIHKQVPEYVIDKFYSRFENQQIPSGIKVIKPEELNSIFLKRIDLSNYDKIVHIGDIHGCYTVLMEYFKNGLDSNTFYIFVGDYIDRGIENTEVLNFLFSIMNEKNVLLLEGNHERWIYCYGNDEMSKSREFELNTANQLRENGISKKDCRMLYRKLGQCAYYTYDDKVVFVSHGGISDIPGNISFIATEQMIKGVGSYNDFEKIADTWMKNTSYYQIYGHRNTKSSPIRIRDRVFNLEGKVEFGGHLRIVELSHDGFKEIELKNNVFKNIDEENPIIDADIAGAVIAMRHNKYIIEKKFDNISSFNFSKTAFEDKIWNNQTITARGLYIDTNRMKVFCRGYSKFFNINEREEVKFENLERKLKFPVSCYVKYNGFLGLVAYNYKTDDLFFTTKSDPNGDYAQWFKEIFYNTISPATVKQIKTVCKEKDITFVFECIDMKNDPHVIDYGDKRTVILLDVIYNKLNFEKMDYRELKNLDIENINYLRRLIKTRAYIINTWQEFYDWYFEVTADNYKYNDEYIEGFVIEDSNGFMLKLKTQYYNFWKYMRSIAAETIRKGYIDKSRFSSLVTPTANNFYGWIKRYVESLEDKNTCPRDIVTLRRMFEG